MNRSGIKHSNKLVDGSRYAANFDYLMHDYCLRKFGKYLKDKGCIEFGCYHGEMTKKLSELCNYVKAVDNDMDCLNKAKLNNIERSNIDYIHSDFSDFKEYADSDVIYFSHALEHVPDDRGLLLEVNKNIFASQNLIIIVPNGRSLSRQIAVKMGLLEFELSVTDFEKKIGHYRTYDLSKLRKLSKDCGFEILESGGIMPKIFSNNQFDRAIECQIIDKNYLDSLYMLSEDYPGICSSIYVVLRRGKNEH